MKVIKKIKTVPIELIKRQFYLECLIFQYFQYFDLQDAMRAVTRNAVREARLKEIKQEILTSQKLKVISFFV